MLTNIHVFLQNFIKFHKKESIKLLYLIIFKILTLITIIILFTYYRLIPSLLKLMYDHIKLHQYKQAFIGDLLDSWFMWFTEWVSILNFIVCVSFALIFIIRMVNQINIFDKPVKKLGNKYHFFKSLNTIYLIYLALGYNLVLILFPKAIEDYNPVTHKIAFDSVVDHMLNPLFWIFFCVLDKNNLSTIKNKREAWKKILLNSFFISSFIIAYFVYSQIRNVFVHNGDLAKWGYNPSEAYPYIDWYEEHAKIFLFFILGLFSYILLSLSIMFYWNRKNKNLVSTYYKIGIASYKAIKVDPLIGFKKIKNIKWRKNIKIKSSINSQDLSDEINKEG